MRLAALVALILGLAAVAYADTTDDLKACQAQTATLTMQARDAQQARTAYVAQLAEMIAEMRAQLTDKNAQIQSMVQELHRLRATPKETK